MSTNRKKITSGSGTLDFSLELQPFKAAEAEVRLASVGVCQNRIGIARSTLLHFVPGTKSLKLAKLQYSLFLYFPARHETPRPDMWVLMFRFICIAFSAKAAFS